MSNTRKSWQVMLGIILIVIATFSTNAQTTKLFPVTETISPRASNTLDTISNEPYSEKIAYPLPPGVTLSTPASSTQTNQLTTPSQSPQVKDGDTIANKFSKPEETLTVIKDSNKSIVIRPTTDRNSQEVIQFRLESTLIPLSPTTEGPLTTEENDNIKTSSIPILPQIKIKEETVITHPLVISPSIEETSTTTGPFDKGILINKSDDRKESTTFKKGSSLFTTESLSHEIKTTSPGNLPISHPKTIPCTTPIGKPGQCKDIRQCPSLLTLLRREPLLVESKLYLQRSQCGFEEQNVLACCPDSAPGPITSPKWSLLPKSGKCGTIQENRLYGGPHTEIDSYSWMALLEYTKGGTNTGFHCGGSLINDRYVLTAAHCVTNLPDTWSIKSVRLGEWDVSTNMDCVTYFDFIDCSDPHINVPIEKVIPHKDYLPTSKNQLHDIALIRLSVSVNTTDFIEPICLPNVENNLHAFDDQSLDLVGWGATVEGLLNSNKQKATAQVIPLNKCRSEYAKYNLTLEQSQFCVEGRLKNDTCRIDSGGPVVSFDTSNQGLGSYYLAGIQSFGVSACWGEGSPGVYTRVGNYLDWILENIDL